MRFGGIKIKTLALTKSSRIETSKSVGFWFTLPTILWLLAFTLLPMLIGFVISFYQYNPLSKISFTGLSNYAGIFRDPVFLDSLLGTVFYVFGTVVPVWVFSFGLALILSKKIKYSSVWKVFLFLPSIMPTISVCLLWIPLLNENGPINNLLIALNLKPVSWLTSPEAAPWAMIIMSWWHATSYYTFIFLAGILAIPKDYYEAAKIDGAKTLSRFWYITIPLLKRTIALVVVMSIINALQTFAFQAIVTQGGPGTSTQIITLLIYRTGFEYQNMGRAAAMSVILFTLTFIFSLIQLRLFRED